MNDIDSGKTLAVSGSRRKPILWITALMAIPCLGVIAILAFGYFQNLHLPTGMAFLPPFLLLVLAFIIWSILRAGVRVDQGMLIVQTGLFASRMAFSELRQHGLRVVNFDEQTQLKPVLKIAGTGLPGFTSGLFRLRNGERATCLLLNRDRVCYLRNDVKNRSLLLSLAEPEKLRTLLDPSARR